MNSFKIIIVTLLIFLLGLIGHIIKVNMPIIGYFGICEQEEVYYHLTLREGHLSLTDRDSSTNTWFEDTRFIGMLDKATKKIHVIESVDTNMINQIRQNCSVYEDIILH